ncbi:uncharacterized protein LOC143858150 [Tasmannia lanceolata]|uniref:uncharacterized protein LOC143858150 n=1 Tax=Tasmannia lanceolata TaxID=3420 RepID=UPI0040646D62
MACSSQSMMISSQKIVLRSKLQRKEEESCRKNQSLSFTYVKKLVPYEKVGKLSSGGLAVKSTKVAGTYSSLKRGWAGYVEKDTAAQVIRESGAYAGEREIISGSRNTSAKADNNMATFTGLSLISIAAIASMFLQVGPAFSQNSRPFQQIFHPPTGLCVLRETYDKPLKLGPCAQSERWSYTPQKILTIKGTYFCLQAVDSSKPAKLGITCTDPGSKWDRISDSKNHLMTTLANGNSVCLDVDSTNTIITNSCKCQSGNRVCDSATQWFEIVTTTSNPAK